MVARNDPVGVIPPRTTIGPFTITVTPQVGMVTVSKPGILVPEIVFDQQKGQDGTLRECYDKCIKYCEDNK